MRIFLEVIVAPAVEQDALEILARRPNMRVVLDPRWARPPLPGLELRSAGGGSLPRRRRAADDPAGWTVATQRPPSADEPPLDFAWRVCRHVKSNAIVLVGRRSSVWGRDR